MFGPQIVAAQPRWRVVGERRGVLADIEQAAAQDRSLPGFACEEQALAAEDLIAVGGEVEPHQVTVFAERQKAAVHFEN